MSVGHRDQQGQAGTDIRASAERDLPQVQAVIAAFRQRCGVDPMSSDQLGRLAGEGVGLVDVCCRSSLVHQLADSIDETPIDGSSVDVGGGTVITLQWRGHMFV